MTRQAPWSAKSRKAISDERLRKNEKIAPPQRPQDRGIVHILTCGSVDDGKSTLIGRLLWDGIELPDDQREMVRRAAKASGNPQRLDYSLLLDGLIANGSRASPSTWPGATSTPRSAVSC